MAVAGNQKALNHKAPRKPGKKSGFMAPAKDAKKVRQSQAQKRARQSEERNLRNRAFKSQVRTTLRHLDESLKGGNLEEAKTQLQLIHSLADKGTKHGIYKTNKAARLKSQVSTRVLKVTTA